MKIRVVMLSLLVVVPWRVSMPSPAPDPSPGDGERAPRTLTATRAAFDNLTAPEMLRGRVRSESGAGAAAAVPGAIVYWLGSAIGTTTDSMGAFAIRRHTGEARLVVRHAAFEPDTLVPGDAPRVEVVLRPLERTLEEVDVIGNRAATTVDYLSPESRIRMGERELAKAACCNLSEAFETNPSVDVTFTDAITGTRQIEMLGLSGIYAQTTMENLPYIRGLTSNVGLTFIPGPWIEEINVSKGIGSVANGYESITGQIDVGIREPQNEDEPQLHVNGFGNQDARLEGNLAFRQPLGEHWGSMTLLHASGQRTEVDENGDGYLDTPRYSSVNVAQRLQLSTHEDLEGHISLQYVGDRRDGGTLQGSGSPANPFLYSNRSELVRADGKFGYVDPADRVTSVGVQWFLTRYRSNSHFGPRGYDAAEETGYVNLIVQSDLGDEAHRFRAGLSFLYDRYDETFDGAAYDRVERVPGIFLEYTLSRGEALTVVAGLRADAHNAYGTFLSPRLHVRFAPDAEWVLRAMGGRGYRTASIFAENSAAFASNREVRIEPTINFGYGLMQEAAWNVGVNLTHYFTVGSRPATVSADVHRTVFDRQVVADLDSYPGEVRFYGVEGGSHAQSVQIELDLQALRGLNTRLAYRFLDAQQTLNGVRLQKPLSARHRALVNAGYTLEDGDHKPGRTAFDVTVQWFGPKRIPDTGANPVELRAREWSPSFAVVSAQVSRSFSDGLEIYLGGENLFDFRQDDPIIDPSNPTSPYFDASLVWGPTAGRMVYAGVRYRL